MTEQKIEIAENIPGIINGSGKGPGIRGTVIITHGAGAGMTSSILAATAEKLADADFTVLRFNFSYLQRRSAPSAGGKKELPELIQAINYMDAKKLFLVGKSFGARVAANAALERDDVRGLVFYGMPLKGASKAAKPRDWSHLARIKAPMLFVTGDKDQLCPLDRLAGVLQTLTSPHKSEIVPGDHSYKPRGESSAISLAVEWLMDASK